MPSAKAPLESLERLSREARIRTPTLLGSKLSWTLLWLGLSFACASILVALAAVAFYREDGPDSQVELLRGVVEWISIAGIALSFLGFFAPLLVLIAIRACGRDPHAIMADRRRRAAVKFARFLAHRLDRLAIDTARRAAEAEISRFERRKFMFTLLAGAGAAVTAIAKAMGPEAAAWVDPVALVGAALASGTTLGLLTMLDFVDRLNRILDALNEAEVILEARDAQMKIAGYGHPVLSRLTALVDASVRRLAHLVA